MAYTDEQLDKLIGMLKFNLEMIFDYMDAESKNQKETQLQNYIDASIVFIEREGVTLNYENQGDCQLIVMYAQWLYDKRKDPTSRMPRMLRWNLNNRVFGEQV